jgi:hypothetical protein
MYLYVNNFLTEEEVIYARNFLFSQKYRFIESIGAAKDNVVGLTSNNFSDNGIMVVDFLDLNFATFLINKFAKKNNVKIKKILRQRGNLTFRSKEQRPMDPHVDLRRVEKHYTFVYYVNDSEGNTNLYNKRYTGEEVDPDSLTLFKSFEPKAGYALFFDGDIFHNWEYPKESDFRSSVVINIVCEIDESIMEKVPF